MKSKNIKYDKLSNVVTKDVVIACNIIEDGRVNQLKFRYEMKKAGIEGFYVKNSYLRSYISDAEKINGKLFLFYVDENEGTLENLLKFIESYSNSIIVLYVKVKSEVFSLSYLTEELKIGKTDVSMINELRMIFFNLVRVIGNAGSNLVSVLERRERECQQ